MLQLHLTERRRTRAVVLCDSDRQLL